MMRLSAMALIVALPLVAGLAGCASPPMDLFTLAAVPGVPSVAAPSRTHSLELRRIGLAGYLDRPGIVRSTVQYRLQVSDRDRWGEPLGGMVERVFTEDLVSRMPGTAVFAEAGAISTQPDAVLELDIQRFDTDPSGDLVLLAQIAIRHDTGKRPTIARTLRLTQHLPSDGTQDLVAAMSALLGQLADRVTEMMR